MEFDRRKISALYHAALKRPPGERAAFLNEACDGDEAFRQEVESLLGFESVSTRFLEVPAADVIAGALALGSTQMVGQQLARIIHE